MEGGGGGKGYEMLEVRERFGEGRPEWHTSLARHSLSVRPWQMCESTGSRWVVRTRLGSGTSASHTCFIAAEILGLGSNVYR